MSGLAAPTSPKYGYHFDPQEMDLFRARHNYACVGARWFRGSPSTGPHASDCRPILARDIYVAVINNDLFGRDTKTCLPCALAHGIVQPVEQ